MITDLEKQQLEDYFNRGKDAYADKVTDRKTKDYFIQRFLKEKCHIKDEDIYATRDFNFIDVFFKRKGQLIGVELKKRYYFTFSNENAFLDADKSKNIEKCEKEWTSHITVNKIPVYYCALYMDGKMFLWLEEKWTSEGKGKRPKTTEVDGDKTYVDCTYHYYEYSDAVFSWTDSRIWSEVYH